MPIKENHGFCLKCQYPLWGLRQPCCPECGCQFDPTDAATFLETRTSGELAKLSRLLILAGPLSIALTELSCHDLLRCQFAWRTGTWLGCGHSYSVAMGKYQPPFDLAFIFMLLALAGMGRPEIRSRVSARYLAWAALIWWLGWYLAIRFGWKAYYLA